MNRNRLLLIAVPVVLIAVIVVGVLILQPTGSPSSATTIEQAITDISPADYTSQFVNTSTQHILIDVRTAEEYATGHIANSVNIALDSISARLSEIPLDQPVVLYCRSGNRSAQAAEILAEAGYTNIRDLGGINDWTAQGYPVQ